MIYQGAGAVAAVVGHYTDNKPLPFGMAAAYLRLRAELCDICAAARPCLASAPPFFIPSRRGSPARFQVTRTGWRSRCFKWAATVIGGAVHPAARAARPCLIRASGSRGHDYSVAAGSWYQNQRRQPGHTPPIVSVERAPLPSRELRRALAILIALMFSKFFYLASITSYHIFDLIHRFHVTTEAPQIDLFVFLAASAAGTFFGGPIDDRLGRKTVIWVSIVGVLPFTLLLHYVGLAATVGLSVMVGLVLSSAFSAIVVYAQELMPGRVGMVPGFGFAFGIAGVGAAVLGVVADMTSIDFVYRVCAFLPLIRLLTPSFLTSKAGSG